MSSQPASNEGIRQLRRQVEITIEQLAALSGSEMSPADFYQELVRKGLSGIDAPAGAVWLRTPQGMLQPVVTVNLEKIGLDDHSEGRKFHNELLSVAFEKNAQGLLGPKALADGHPEAGNPTNLVLAFAPILDEDNRTLGMLEIFQKPTMHPDDLLKYTLQVAGFASNFVRNNTNRKTIGQEKIWTMLDAFSKQIHASLDPTQVAYVVANEGRRLIECDRICVGVRHGRKTTIEAVSGADVVEKASSHIVLMRKLFDSVIQWGERLEYRGENDETLPPKVYEALNNYLREQNPKLLVLIPLRDEREQPKPNEKLKVVRSALMMEVFDPPAKTDLLEKKLEIVGSHAAGALYNASEMKQVPLKPLWWPLKRVQQGLGGKARFWLFTGLFLFAALLCALVFIPYDLKVDAGGKLAPLDRLYVYPDAEGQVVEFRVKHDDTILPASPVALMRSTEFELKITAIQSQLRGMADKINTIEGRINSSQTPFQEKEQLRTERSQLLKETSELQSQLNFYEQRFLCDLSRPGLFQVLAPSVKPSLSGAQRWRVVTPDFREELVGKTVKPSDSLLRLGNVDGGWLVVLKIPQKHIGQVLRAYPGQSDDEFLWVDVLARSAPTPGYQGKGKLSRKDITAEAIPNRDDQNESEPVVYAYVRMNTADIPKEYHLDERLLVTDAEISAKIRCGKHAMGYSMFYGVWEFLYEKVVFYLF